MKQAMGNLAFKKEDLIKKEKQEFEKPGDP